MKTIETQIKIKRDPASEKSLKDTERMLSQFATGTSGMFEALKSAGATGAVVAIGITALGAAARLAAQGVQFLAEQLAAAAERGGDVAGAQRAFNAIASPEILSRIEAVTHGLIGETDAMRAYFTLASKGIVGDEAIRFMEQVADRARIMGQDVTEAMNAAASSVSRSNLDETLLNLQTGMTRVGEGSLTAAEGFDRLRTSVSNAYDQFSSRLTSNDQMRATFDGLSTSLGRNTSAWDLLGNHVGNVVAHLMLEGARVGLFYSRFARDVLTFEYRAARAIGATQTAEGLLTEAVAANAGVILAENTLNAIMESQARQREQRSNPPPTTTPGAQPDMVFTPDEVSALRTAAEQRAAAARTAAQEAEQRRTRELELQGQQHQASINLVEKEIARTESLRELDREIREFDLAQNMALIEAQQERHDKVMQDIREESDLRKAMIAAEEEMRQARFDRAVGLTEQAAGGAQLISDTLGQIADYQQEQVDRQVEAMTAANEAHIAGLRAAGATEAEIQSAVVKGNAEIAAASQAQVKSIDNLRKAEGAFLIAYNAVMAAVEVAKAIAAFGSQKYVEGAAHVLAAAAYGVAAGMAAAKLGGGSAGSTPSVSAGTFTPAKKPVADTSKGDGAGVTINNVYSLGPSEAGVGRALEQAQWTRTKRGVSTGSGLGVEYDA